MKGRGTLLQAPNTEGISGEELLQEVYDFLFYEQVEEIVELEEPFRVVIAHERDLGREDIGYMEYLGGKVVSINGKHWFLGKGETGGSYLAYDHYTGDIRVCRGDRPNGLGSLISGFADSALIITAKGNLAIDKYGPFQDLRDLLTTANDYDLTPKEKFTIYKPEFVEVVVSRIEEVIRKHSA